MRRPFTILVVDDDVASMSGLLELLRDAGYRVTGAADFEAATRLLSVFSFDLLISDVRLKESNGLRLIARGQIEHPGMAAIAITGFHDQALEIEAQRHGATYVIKPLNPPQFLDLVAEHLATVKKQRRWPRKQVAGGFGALIGASPVRVVDMSYGGLRFESASVPEQMPPSIRVSLPAFDLQVRAEPVWTDRAGASGSWLCGAELSEPDREIARAWRSLVDSLPAPEAL